MSFCRKIVVVIGVMFSAARKKKAIRNRDAIVRVARQAALLGCIAALMCGLSVRANAHDVTTQMSSGTISINDWGRVSGALGGVEPFASAPDPDLTMDQMLKIGSLLVHDVPGVVLQLSPDSGCLRTGLGWGGEDFFPSPFLPTSGASADQKIELLYDHPCFFGGSPTIETHRAKFTRFVSCVAPFHELDIGGDEVGDLRCVHVNQRPVYAGPTAPRRLEVSEGGVLDAGSFAGVVTDPDSFPAPLRFTMSGLEGVSGVFFVPSTGQLTLFPRFDVSSQDADAVFTVEFNVDDGELDPLQTIPPLTVVVNNVNRAPTISGPTSASVNANKAFSAIFSATDPDGEPITFSTSPLPAGLSLTSTPGAATISGTPTTSGTFNITVTASDGNGPKSLSANASFKLTVGAPNLAPTASITIQTVLPSTDENNAQQGLGLNEFVTFDGSSSNDPEGQPITAFKWKVDGQDATEKSPRLTRQFSTPGPHTVSLIVNDGQLDSAEPAAEAIEVLQYDRGQSRGRQVCNGTNPIDQGTGNKFQPEVDYVGAGTNPLTFQRYYNSSLVVGGKLGAHWRHTFERSVIKDVQPTVTVTRVFRQNGAVLVFSPPGTGTLWLAPAGVTDKLEELPGTGWKFTTTDDLVETYNTAGQLLAITNKAGQAITLSYNGAVLDAVTDSFGRKLAFEYDGAGMLSKVFDPANPRGNAGSKPIIFGYDAFTNLQTVTRQNNTVRTYHYEDGRFPAALGGITNELNKRYATFRYDDKGRGIFSGHAGGANATNISYTNDNTMVITDALGKARTYTVESINGVMRTTNVNAECATSCGGSVASTTFDANGYPDFTTDFRGNITDYTYDGVRGLETSRIEAKDKPVARTFQTTWHPTFNVPTCLVEPLRTVKLDYTTNGLLQTRTEFDTSDASKFADLASKACTAIAARGDVASLTQRQWGYTYFPDASPLKGMLSTVDGPLPGITDQLTYGYDAATGNLTSVTNGLGHSAEFLLYDAHGHVLVSKDANGVFTENIYDALGRLTNSKRGPGSFAQGASSVSFTKFEQSTMTYDDAGNPDVVTGPNGAFVNYDFDEANRLTDVRDNLGNHLHYVPDALGNVTLTEIKDPTGVLRRVHSNTYNVDNQIERSDGMSRGTDTIFTKFVRYDSNGNLEEQQDAAGNATIYGYDELNRLSTVQDPVNGAANLTRYGYDAQGRVKTVTDTLGNATTYTTDGLGNVKQVVSKDTGTTTMPDYDQAGHVKTKTDARNKTTRYKYDDLGRLDLVTYNDNTTADYVWDQGANSIGRLSSITDSVGQTNYGYDEFGRIKSKQHVLDGKTFGVNYGFNSQGELETITYPSGKVVRYTHTGGLVTEVSVDGGATIMSGISYDPFGPVKSWNWGTPTVAVKRDTDSDGLTQGVTMPSGARAMFSYYNTGNIKDITSLGNVGDAQSFTYDALYRLDTYTGPANASHDYNLDGNGNRTTTTVNGTLSTYAPVPNTNRLQTITGGITRTYGYDAAGNTTSDGTRTYGYDDRGRFVNLNNGQFQYSINTLGQRVAKTAPAAGDANADGVITTADASLVTLVIGQQAIAPGNSDCTNDNRIDVLDITCINNRISSGNTTAPAQKRYFAYDEAGHLIGEYDNNGVAIQETIWLGDLPVAVLSNNETHLIYADHLNTPRVITRLDGTVVWRWASDPFGAQLPNEDVDGDKVLFVYNLRFPGQYYDQESQLHYNYFRSYDPSTGRYVEADPIGLGGGMNLYGYVGGNSLRGADTYGLYMVLVHGAITYSASRGADNGILDSLKYAAQAMWADVGTQSAKLADTRRHAMRSGSDPSTGTIQTMDSARAEFESLVRDSLNSSSVVLTSQFNPGEGVHAVQDYTAPMHANFAVWSGEETLWDKLVHLYHDTFAPYDARKRAYDFSVEYFRALNGKLGSASSYYSWESQACTK